MNSSASNCLISKLNPTAIPFVGKVPETMNQFCILNPEIAPNFERCDNILNILAGCRGPPSNPDISILNAFTYYARSFNSYIVRLN